MHTPDAQHRQLANNHCIPGVPNRMMGITHLAVPHCIAKCRVALENAAVLLQNLQPNLCPQPYSLTTQQHDGWFCDLSIIMQPCLQSHSKDGVGPHGHSSRSMLQACVMTTPTHCSYLCCLACGWVVNRARGCSVERTRGRRPVHTWSVATAYDCTCTERRSLLGSPGFCAGSQLIVLPTNLTSPINLAVKARLQCTPACMRVGERAFRCEYVIDTHGTFVFCAIKTALQFL